MNLGFTVARRVLAAVLAGLALVISAGVLGVAFALSAKHASDEALATLLPAATSANQLLADVVDQETGERGYVITEQASFLQPYDAGRRAVPGLEAKLGRELVGHSVALGLLHDVEARYETWLTAFAMPQIDQVRRGNEASAIATERTGRGKQLLDDLRVAMSALVQRIDVEQRGLTDRVEGLQTATFYLVVGMILCGVAGSGLVLLLSRRWVIRPIEDLEAEVGLVAAGAVDHTVRVEGPPEIFSLGESVERMRLRVREAAAEAASAQRDAVTLQRALLPKVLPTPSGFEITARYLPGAAGAEVGGDWYNVRDAGGKRAFFAVGDVSGRGIEAAALMAALRYGINAYAAEDPRPGEVLARLGRLSELGRDGRFATVLAGLVDAQRREVALASAGHLAPVLVEGGVARLVQPKVGPPIGLGFDAYTETVEPVPETATLLVFTDGLVERRGDTIDASLDRLAAVASADLPLEHLVDHVHAALVPGGSHDDIVILGIRWQS